MSPSASDTVLQMKLPQYWSFGVFLFTQQLVVHDIPLDTHTIKSAPFVYKAVHDKNLPPSFFLHPKKTARDAIPSLGQCQTPCASNWDNLSRAVAPQLGRMVQENTLLP